MQSSDILNYFLIAGGASILLFGLVLFLWRALRNKYNFGWKLDSRIPYLDALIFSYFFIVLGFMIDYFWHASIGRDDFWIPPHLLILVSAVTLGFFSILSARKFVGKNLFPILSVTLFTGMFGLGLTFDDTIHQLFGQENVFTALVFYAPPHLFMLIALIFLGFILAILLKNIPKSQNSTINSFVLKLITLGSLFAFIEYITSPFWPFFNYHIFDKNVLSTSGAFFVAFILGLSFIVIRRFFKEVKYSGFMFVLFASFLIQLGSLNYFNPIVPIPPSLPLPLWLIPFSLVMSALVSDVLFNKKYDLFINGLFFGLVLGAIFYPSAYLWFYYRGFIREIPGIVFIIIMMPVLLSGLGSGAAFILFEKVRRVIKMKHEAGRMKYEA